MKEEIKPETLKLNSDYSGLSTNIQIVGLVLQAVGLILGATGIIPEFRSLIVILIFMFLVFLTISILNSYPRLRGPLRVLDWNWAIVHLERLRFRAERPSENEYLNKFNIDLYNAMLRRVYYSALIEGKEKFAEALWDKGQLCLEDKTER